MSFERVTVLGHTGMAGGYLSRYLEQNGYTVALPEHLDARTASEDAWSDMLYSTRPQVVINCIGIIKQRDVPPEDMVAVNAKFPHALMKVCKGLNVPLIHISTDCVFNGERGKYTEDDTPDAEDIYGKSKTLGEPAEACIIRTSIIGSEKRNKLSLLEWVKKQRSSSCKGYTNHWWNGVTALQLAEYMRTLLESQTLWQGARHYHSPHDISKFELIRAISTTYDLHVTVEPIEVAACNRTLRSIYPFASPPDILSQLRQQVSWDKKQDFYRS